MSAHVVELIPRPETPAGERSVLTLEREDSNEWLDRKPSVWVKVHVGIVFRKSSSWRPPTGQHCEDWVWFDFGNAGEAMEHLRKPGTSVLVLSTWAEVRRRGWNVLLRPTRCEAMQNLRWTAKFDRSAAEMAHVALRPGEEAVFKLLPRSRTKWRYEGRDRRAWEKVQLRLVEEGSHRPETRPALDGAGQLRLFWRTREVNSTSE
jgi:hypothetical protein